MKDAALTELMFITVGMCKTSGFMDTGLHFLVLKFLVTGVSSPVANQPVSLFVDVFWHLLGLC